MNKSSAHICNNWYKLYVPIVTLWTQDNAELRKQLESAFIKTINWNKY